MAANLYAPEEVLIYSLSHVNEWMDDEPIQHLEMTTNFGLNLQINFELTVRPATYSITTPCCSDILGDLVLEGKKFVTVSATHGRCLGCAAELPRYPFEYEHFDAFPRSEAEAALRLKFDPMEAVVVAEAVEQVVTPWRNGTVADWPRPFKGRELKL